jgi:BirA family biotin operon repressor/biotin-[acetyl-CoA-carboxylase] ligase
MYTVLTEFEQNGFAPFVDEWCSYDWLANRSVVAKNGQRSISGTARGIATDGALLIETNGDLQRLVSGEVSLRPGCEGKI